MEMVAKRNERLFNVYDTVGLISIGYYLKPAIEFAKYFVENISSGMMMR
jgi:hypothetical protein